MFTVISPTSCPFYGTCGGWAFAVSSLPPSLLPGRWSLSSRWQMCSPWAAAGTLTLVTPPGRPAVPSMRPPYSEAGTTVLTSCPVKPLAPWENCSALCLLTVNCSLPQGKICSLRSLSLSIPSSLPRTHLCSLLGEPSAIFSILTFCLDFLDTALLENSCLNLIVCAVLTFQTLFLYHNAEC